MVERSRDSDPDVRAERQKLIDLNTGLEEQVEKLTDDPYERLFLLSLAVDAKVAPGSIPLEKPLCTWDYPPRYGPYGIDALNVVEVSLIFEELLGVVVDGAELESIEPSVRALAALHRKNHR